MNQIAHRSILQRVFWSYDKQQNNGIVEKVNFEIKFEYK